jgi:hypothetical protein
MKGFMTSTTTVLVALLLLLYSSVNAAESPTSDWQAEWQRVMATAKKEGKVVVSVPPGAELRKALKEGFERRFGIGLELVTGRASAIVKKIAEAQERHLSCDWIRHLGSHQESATPQRLKSFHQLVFGPGRPGDTYQKALGESTRRLDVEVPKEPYAVRPARESMTIEQYHQLESHSEEKQGSVRKPSIAAAQRLLE